MTTDLPLPALAEQFHLLFEGHPENYGLSELTGSVGARDGKIETENHCTHKPLTARIWEKHLNGERSIYVFPLRPDHTVRWAALDVDIYTDEDVLKDIYKKVSQYKLPLIPCRSKSGGLHLYWFFSEPVLAATAIDRIRLIAAFIGQASCEVFPKHSELGSHEGSVVYGNGLNMPYVKNEMRYAYRPEDPSYALSATEFLDYAKELSSTNETLNAFMLPDIEGEPWPDGPPCLNTIFTDVLNTVHRNDLLFNLVLYFKKSNPDKVEALLTAANQKLAEPLETPEVARVLKSATKKDYHYKCSQQPICRFCQRNKCGQRKFGRDKDHDLLDPNNKTLVKVNSSPPLWYITLEDQTIQLTSDELAIQSKFKLRVMESLLKVIPIVEAKEWESIKKLWLDNCTVIEVPEDATPLGQLKTVLWEYMTVANKERDALTTSGCWMDEEHDLLYFTVAKFQDYLKRRQFIALKPHEIITALRHNMGVKEQRLRVGLNQTRCWVLDTNKLDKAYSVEEVVIEDSPI